MVLVSQAAVAVPLYPAAHVTAVQAVPALQLPEYAPEAVVAAQSFGAVRETTERFGEARGMPARALLIASPCSTPSSQLTV